jgi:hypothetical protein
MEAETTSWTVREGGRRRTSKQKDRLWDAGLTWFFVNVWQLTA